MTARDSKREFDVVVWGATGFTGALVASYLARRYGTAGDLRWAIAGRNKDKLTALRASLGDAAEALPILTADSADRAALAAMAARTRVVLTTVGPYALYGSPLVSACVETGTDYCDLAGEVPWIRQMIDEHHEHARDTGARIVHCCGFDSIPMDIGVWFLQQAAHERFGEYCSSVATFVKAAKGTFSGGTLASMANMVERSRKDRHFARILVEPYSLNPPAERKGPDGRDQRKVLYDDLAGAWTAPFVMAGINTKVVRRSHALAGFPWGRDFRYREAVITGRGPTVWMGGTAVTLGLGAFVLGMALKPSRQLMQRFFLPDPGEGPSPEMQQKGFFRLEQVGTTSDGREIRTGVTGDQDPGYGSTSKMLSESAVCLAMDDLDTPGGVLTPSAAMAAPLLERLRSNAGLTFDVLD